MFGSEILEVTIGLVLVYLLLSLICSVVKEWIARIFALRAKMLKKGIGNLLEDEALVERLYQNPMISRLYLPKKREGWKGGPSYLSSRNFALALFDTITEAGKNPEAIKNGSESLQKRAKAAYDELVDGVSKIEGASVRQALLARLDTIRRETEKWDEALGRARIAVENWFDDAMDRVSGWYTRRTQTIIIITALVVCVVLNADSLMLSKYLARNPAIRASVAAAAAETVKTLPVPIEGATPSEAAGVEGETAPGEEATIVEAVRPPVEEYRRLEGELQKLEIPIGWVKRANTFEGDPRVFPDSVGGILLKSLGLLWTSLAVSLGAPFWFGALKKLVNLRSAGTVAAKAPVVEEEPKKLRIVEGYPPVG